MSGIATATSRMIEKVRSAGYKTRIACTRKTAPGLLYFDKRAVMIGGGDTHRLHLDDLIIIKDNHLMVVGDVHILEAIFKGFGRALRMAVEIHPHAKGIPSTKGTL
ncbi:MAG: hypothetical protein JSU99_08555 [Nitrospiraceae bacterium]|nr:MAG: hypothetical protein JSU99_08555 [Nitrospiraceae bacterium]